MIAIITDKFSMFYDLSKQDRFFCNSRWVYSFETCFGYRFDSYFLAFGGKNIKDIDKIIEYLEAHNVKRIYD